jgi:hypothetical protein
MRWTRAVLCTLVASSVTLGAQKQEPTLEDVLGRVGAYVAAYGEQAAVVVATEKYTQSVSFAGSTEMPRPRELEAEFAIVRAAGGWTGYRDVIQVDGKAVQDRKDRLVELLTNTSGDANEVTRIANENARFNIGPISRNFNVPTVAMFFFLPKEHARFAFTRKGTPRIDGTQTWEIQFKETQRPTLIRTRAGVDVPMEGSLWVKPDDGVVVRTYLKMRNFLDREVAPQQGAPMQRPTDNPASKGGEAIRTPSIPDMSVLKLESEATIDVTYRKPPNLDLWFPASMTEFYSGPLMIKNRPIGAAATTRAKYSNFRQFGTSIKIVP